MPCNRPTALRRARWTALAVLLAGAAGPALALYKVVGPDGRVTYTDRPPTDDAAARISTLQSSGAVSEAAGPQAALPLQLRQAATRYPVVLYAAADCPPCDEGRALLQQRGIPFTEKLVVSEDDAAAMEKAVATRSVPSLSIGTQALRGLSQTEWNAYLDAAGYPRESQLPKGWQAPPATPLVARRSVAPASAPASAPTARAAPPGLVAPPASGIRF